MEEQVGFLINQCKKLQKKTFLEELLEIFSEVNINNISEDNDTENEYTIRILSKL
jgi:hypothetical protein